MPCKLPVYSDAARAARRRAARLGRRAGRDDRRSTPSTPNRARHSSTTCSRASATSTSRSSPSVCSATRNEAERDADAAVDIARVNYLGPVSVGVPARAAHARPGSRHDRGVVVGGRASGHGGRTSCTARRRRAWTRSSRAWATASSGSGVKVMIVRPGFVDTKMTKGMDAAPAVHHGRRGRRRHRARPGPRQRDRLGAVDASLRHVGAAARPPPDLPQAADLMPPQSERPVDATPVHTDDLAGNAAARPEDPRDRVDRSAGAVLDLGADLDEPDVNYLRRIGPWLLWRAGPPSRGDARYLALSADDLGNTWTFRVFPDGSGEGEGPDGVVHHRFRTWKEASPRRGDRMTADPDDDDGHGVPVPAARRRRRRLRAHRRRRWSGTRARCPVSSTSRRSSPTTASACRSSCSRPARRTTPGATTRATAPHKRRARRLVRRVLDPGVRARRPA